MRGSSSVPRGAAPGWTRPIADRLTPAVRTLIIVQSVLFAFYLFAEPARTFFEEQLVVGPGFAAGRLWQPLTAVFVNVQPLSFLFDLLGLWFIAALVERTWGTTTMLVALLVSGIAGHAATGALLPFVGGLGSTGSGVAVLALMVVVGVMFGRTELQILGGLFMRARTFAFILLGLSVVVDLAYGAFANLVGTLLACGVAVLIVRRREQPRRPKPRPRAPRFEVLDGGRASEDRPRYLN